MREPPATTLHDDTIRDVAREARTALSSICGYLEIVEEESPDSSDDLTRIREATDRVLELVALLERQVDFARAEANRDALTGAANRRTLMARGEALFLSDNPLSLLLMDVDKFKDINDTYGHLVGDEALRILVDRCRRASRDTDLVARYAGDELVILLPGTGTTEAERVARRMLLHIVQSPFSTSAGEVRVGVSLGVATRAPTDTSMEGLMKRADGAMYAAKQSGGAKVVRL